MFLLKQLSSMSKDCWDSTTLILIKNSHFNRTALYLAKESTCCCNKRVSCTSPIKHCLMQLPWYTPYLQLTSLIRQFMPLLIDITTRGGYKGAFADNSHSLRAFLKNSSFPSALFVSSLNGPSCERYLWMPFRSNYIDGVLYLILTVCFSSCHGRVCDILTDQRDACRSIQTQIE